MTKTEMEMNRTSSRDHLSAPLPHTSRENYSEIGYLTKCSTTKDLMLVLGLKCK
jgi:hypothetical protein